MWYMLHIVRPALLSRKQPEVFLVLAQACNRFLQTDEQFLKTFFGVPR